MKQAEFTVGDRRGSTSRFCCRNTTNIIEIFGSNCPKSAAELMQEIKVRILFTMVSVYINTRQRT